MVDKEGPFLLPTYKHRKNHYNSEDVLLVSQASVLVKLMAVRLMSEDDERRAEDEIQKITDKHVAEVDKGLEAKETDVMAI